MNKPFIVSMINTSALALTSYGTLQITMGNYLGCFAILFGIMIEWIKYVGMKKKIW